MRIDGHTNFGTRECPSCATEVPRNNNRCPICGYEFPVEPAGKKQIVWLVAAILLLVLIGRWAFRSW